MRTIDQLSDELGGLAGRTVLVRSDLNVPLDGQEITDDGRVRASVPTITRLAREGARVVVCAHLGRPKGTPEAKYSLAPVATRLDELLDDDITVSFVEETVGDRATAAVQALADGDVLVLENLRFNPGETAKTDEERADFAQALAALADAFVSDGFGVVHRAQASVYDVPRLLPHAAGGLVVSEVEVMRALREDPRRPYAVILGGAKVSDKLGVIESLITVADRLLIGGGMVFTFLKAQGHEVGTSLLEEDQVDTVKGYLETAAERGVEIVLPTDVVVADAFSADAAHEVVPADAMPADRMGLDIGPDSEELFVGRLADAQTIFWNGPMGAFEMEPFAGGTRAVAQALVDRTSEGALTVVGGGDSAAAVRDFGHTDDDFSHISTGGGASLEYLEGKDLPGLSVLED
ncbi:Phosphoglycerate kinase [Serinicoccus hydrothermalis]|uniref:Phosphoglycerate kinase n=1 Tax=Serinicoccus hydrothermalis TaxID=1758689 RepID=A0A1B1N8D2_9MICO|nr:phosphoglycerate kinase [Serinicoccus hydrothermalis]ANS77645.1 Phosphoglycerate kinase [Serinicoccus hydrothermalis]